MNKIIKNGTYGTIFGNIMVENGTMIILKKDGSVSKRNVSDKNKAEKILNGKSWKQKKHILGL